jgi:hypothetical protein
VNDSTSFDVALQLSPTMQPPKPGDALTRCIKLEIFSNTVQAPVIFETDVEFGGLFDLIGRFTDKIKVPGAFAPLCLTARDQLHTLRSCHFFGDDDCVDGIWSADFTGDPFFGGNWLLGGNLDGFKKGNPNASHNVIDILDFGMFSSQFLTSYDSNLDGEADGNTPCGTEGPHADINGDGVVDLVDFTFLSLNFLEESKDCCFGSVAAAAPGPRTSISVRELRQIGMAELSVADLNGDGMVDLEDMAAFMRGDRPTRKDVVRQRRESSLRPFGSN